MGLATMLSSIVAVLSGAGGAEAEPTCVVVLGYAVRCIG